MTTITDTDTSPGDLLGFREIAALLGVKYGTVRQWKWRGTGDTNLPEPTATVGGSPAWRRDLIEAWAKSTGRLPTGEPGIELRHGTNGTGPQRWKDGKRLCGLVGCPEPHRARNRCRPHYGKMTGK